MRRLILITFAIFTLTSCYQPKHQYTVVQEGDKDGVINETGYVTVKPIYKHVFNFDELGGYIKHPSFINLHWLHDKTSSPYAFVQNVDGKFGVIDPKGKLLLKPVYDSITYFFNRFLRIEVGGLYGLVDRDFNIVLKPTYDEIGEFVGDIAILKHKDKYGCINSKMELKVKPTYDRIYFQQEEFLRTTLNGKWGFLDDKCNVLSKAIFDYAYDFSNGYAKIILDGKVGFIDSNGKLISKQIFTEKTGSF
jgi:hypothetical protein